MAQITSSTPINHVIFPFTASNGSAYPEGYANNPISDIIWDSNNWRYWLTNFIYHNIQAEVVIDVPFLDTPMTSGYAQLWKHDETLYFKRTYGQETWTQCSSDTSGQGIWLRNQYEDRGTDRYVAITLGTSTESDVTAMMEVDSNWFVSGTHTVTYDANGGSGAPSTGTAAYGVGYLISSAGPSVPKTYTITYNANGGSISDPSKSVSCSFNGWNTNSSGTGTNYSPGQSYIINSNLNLYAKWTNPSAGQLSIPTKTGYTFIGWFTEESGGDEVKADTEISQSQTIYAHWVRNQANCYHNYDSSDTNYQTVEASTSTGNITLPSLSRPGYELLGWYTERSGGTKVGDGGDEYTPTSSTIDVFAHWKLTTYVYTYVDDPENPGQKKWIRNSRVYKYDTDTRTWSILEQGHKWNGTSWEPIVPSGS